MEAGVLPQRILLWSFVLWKVNTERRLGFHLIRNGISTGSDEEREKGEGIIDTWVRDSFTEYGFPRIWFYTAGYEWAKPSFITCYLRYMTDGMEGILDAYLEEKADGVEKETWMARCREYADWLIKAQNEDGSYYRAYNPDTGEVSQGEDGKIGNDKNNTSCAVRYLVRMYEQTKEEKYLDAAIRAGEYVYAHSYLQFTDVTTCVDDFWFREATTEGATVHPQIPCSNWNAGDNAVSRLRVVFSCGSEGTLAGGSVNYYKFDNASETYIKLGRVEIPSNVQDNPEYANRFGIQLWLGTGTVSNITISEYQKTLLTVGGGDTKTTAVNVGVIDGDILPTDCYIKGKYITGWTVDGVEQIKYDASISVDKYVANFVDTKMLEVKVQDSSVIAEENAVNLNARFIASVNSLPEYKTAGLVFSLSNPFPEVGGTNCTNRYTTTVYTSLNVRYSAEETSTSVSVKDLYDDYSTHMFACEITKIPIKDPATKIYARAYVELQDGKKVYGDMRYIAVPGEAFTIEEGEVQPEELSSGGWSIRTDDYSLELYETKDGYDTQIRNAEGEAVAEQIAPVNIQIKNSDDTTTMLAIYGCNHLRR